ncbi:MAG: hypothetical protein JWO38_6542 [Gemmataceae bacterium]|nr:hypothetical protein [Gemmataceae bacterium]
MPTPPVGILFKGFAMTVGVLTLLGSLAAGGPTAPGPVPVPGMGPPAGVAGVGMPGGMAHPLPAGAPVMMPTPQPGMGLPVPAPVLAARVLAPKGVRVTIYPGSPLARMYDAPAVIGFRPGYVYRLELANLPYHPGKVLYPEVEVRGTLVPRAGMKYMDWPTPLLFTQADIERALTGSVITKAVYLEDPEKAIPAEFGLAAPVELTAGSEEEAIKEAVANGRLVAVVRLGNKVPDPNWLLATAVDGTILPPGEKFLRAPVVPPTIPYYACPLYDPLLGPKGPKEECFVDGGDRGDPLGIGPHGRLGGLNPTDVGVEYTMAGRRRVTTSNVVCLCVPRFVIQRAELVPGGFNVPIILAGTVGASGLQGIRDRHAAMAEVGAERPAGFAARQRPKAYIGRLGSAFFLGASRPSVVGQIEGVAVTGAVVEPEVLTAYPSACPLTVTKSVDAPGPVESGAEVTFTIRYVNTGNKPISDVVVSDSLSGRLEYVPGSAQTDRAANLSVAANEVGSVVVRWDLPGVILPGQGGTVKFRAKVR